MTTIVRKAGTHLTPGSFTTWNGERFGNVNRYEVIVAGEIVGWTYRVEVNCVGATYIRWIAERQLGEPLPASYYTRRDAVAALIEYSTWKDTP